LINPSFFCVEKTRNRTLIVGTSLHNVVYVTEFVFIKCSFIDSKLVLRA
jgi:hypothetical protein